MPKQKPTEDAAPKAAARVNKTALPRTWPPERGTHLQSAKAALLERAIELLARGPQPYELICACIGGSPWDPEIKARLLGYGVITEKRKAKGTATFALGPTRFVPDVDGLPVHPRRIRVAIQMLTDCGFAIGHPNFDAVNKLLSEEP